MTTGEFRLYDLGIDDYEEILALWQRAGLSIRPFGRDAPEAFARQMASGAQRVLGLRGADGMLVAVTVLTHEPRKGWINRLAVDPEYRRRGLAQALIAAAGRWFAEDLGLEVWAALIEKHNQASLALFAAAGYQSLDIVYVTRRTRPEA